MTTTPHSELHNPDHGFKRVAILFAGGPAPAANAVISTAAVSFLRNNIDVVGILHGYSHLVESGPDHPMPRGRDYVMVDHKLLKRTRNTQGILIGTARTNPGKDVSEPAHLDDPRADRAAAHGLRRAVLAGGRRPDLDRRRRHAQDGQQVQAVPGAPARRAASGFPSFTCPRRSTTTTWASTSRSATSRPSRPWPARFATCWPTPRRRASISGRDHGPQRRLAGLRSGHRRRGEPGDQRRGHHRQVSRPARKSPIRRPARRRNAHGHEPRRSRRADRGHDAASAKRRKARSSA